MNELLKKIEKSKSIDLNLELKTLILDDIKALLLSTYIVDNNIAQVRESYDKKDATSEISDTTKFYLESIRKGENKEGIKDKVFSNLIDRGVIQAIKNIKAHFSLIELINETNLITLQFLKNFYPKLSKKYDEKKISEISEKLGQNHEEIKEQVTPEEKENDAFGILDELKGSDDTEVYESMTEEIKKVEEQDKLEETKKDDEEEKKENTIVEKVKDETMDSSFYTTSLFKKHDFADDEDDTDKGLNIVIKILIVLVIICFLVGIFLFVRSLIME